MRRIIFFVPNIERGGIEKNLVILSNYFLKKNYNVEIIYSKISKAIKNKINKNINLAKSKKILNIPFFSERIVNSINCFFFLLMRYEFSKKSLILSLQDHPFSIFVAKIKKVPCLIRIANHPVGSLKFYNNKFSFFLKINIKKFFYYFASGIICNSNSSSNFFKKIYKNKSRYIINIYNPIEIKRIKKSKKIQNRIISVGRIQNQKNFFGLIKAFNIVSDKLPNIKLMIIGSGNEKKDLKKLCLKFNLNKKVKFLKYQNPNKFINSSKLFVLNSLWEGLPNILIETQMLRTPILSTNCLSGPSEILKNNKLGYLTPVDDYSKLARNIIYIIKNYNSAKKKTDLAYKALNRFEIKSQCKKYELFINKFY